MLIAGSATPRPESVHAMPLAPAAPRRRAAAAARARCSTCAASARVFTPSPRGRSATLRAAGGKAIVLLNRRGWSNFLSCRSCGRVWWCPECDVALVLHRAGGYLACHHCGHRERVPRAAPTAARRASRATARAPSGSQHDLTAVLDDGAFPVFRLDADVLGSGPAGTRGAVLRGFEAAAAGVLIGTQMVAKGHDFPDVWLGVVLDADATLRFPDFRAEERTFALISQLAGRAGRGGGGRVLVQTLAPDARAIRHAARHDSTGFAAGSCDAAQALAYPPFSHLIRIVLRRRAGAPARRAALELRERLLAAAAAQQAGAGVLGPAPLFRLRGRERQVLVIKAPERPGAVRGGRRGGGGAGGRAAPRRRQLRRRRRSPVGRAAPRPGVAGRLSAWYRPSPVAGGAARRAQENERIRERRAAAHATLIATIVAAMAFASAGSALGAGPTRYARIEPVCGSPVPGEAELLCARARPRLSS